MRAQDDYLDPDKHLWPVELPDWWPEMEQNCEEILMHYRALHWGEVYRKIYKFTDCGPTLGILCSGQDAPAYNLELRRYLADSPVIQIHVSSIVEGMDAETPTVLVDMTKPGALARLQAAIQTTDEAANDLLKNHNAQVRTSRRNKSKRR